MHIALFEACSLEDVTADNRWIFSLHIEFDYSENLAMNQSNYLLDQRIHLMGIEHVYRIKIYKKIYMFIYKIK